MKVQLLCFVLLIACIDAGIKKYPTKYDHVDINALFSSKRYLNHLYSCMMGTGKCTPDATKLKKYFPDMLKTKCSKCSDMQKKQVRRVVEYLMKNKPEMWEGLIKKYDPTRKYSKNILTDPNFLGKVHL